MQANTQKHTNVHMHKHILNLLTHSLRSPCVFYTVFHATLWESAAFALSRGGVTRITMCDTTSVSTRSEFQIKRTPFFYQHSLIASPSLSSSLLPLLPFSQIWSLSTALLCPTPSFPPSPPSPPFSSVVFLLSFSAVQSVSNLSFVYYDVWVR